MQVKLLISLIVLGMSQTYAKMTEAAWFYRRDRPMIISHRGAFGSYPEHSMAAYSGAYYGGTDFIELDVQITKDGYLICQHDTHLDETTDVLYRTDFENKRRLPDEYGHQFFLQDFTLEELRQLGRVQKWQFRSQEMNGLYGILTLQEVIDEVKRFSS